MAHNEESPSASSNSELLSPLDSNEGQPINNPQPTEEERLMTSHSQANNKDTVIKISANLAENQQKAGSASPLEGESRPAPLEKAATHADNLSVHGTAPLYEILTPKEVKLAMYSVYCARFLAVLDATIVAVTLPSILRDLGGVQYLSWLIASYLLSDSVTLPLSGRLSDIYGRRVLYIASLVIFLIGSVLCGAATSIWFLIGSRFLQGIGGGGLTGMTMIIPGDIIPPKERPQIFAFLGIIAGLGALLGPILGGGLTDAYSWRLVFYVNVPPGIFSLGLAWISMKKFEIGGKSLQLDYVGSALIAGSTVCLILFVTWGGEATIGYPWNSPIIISLIVLFVVLGMLFILQEQRHPLPTLQLRLHKIKNVWMCYVIVFFAYYSMISVVNYLAIYFQNVQGDIAVISGLKLGGFVVGFIVMSRFSGKILMKTSKSNIIMGLCCGLTALGLGLTSLLTPTINYGYIFLFTTFLGVGVGYLIPATGAIIQVSVPQRDIAVAMANFSFDSYIGGCIGITVSGTIFTRTLQKNLALGLSPAEATSAGVSDVFLWCVPPVIFASFLGFFLDPVKKKKPKDGMTATTERDLLPQSSTINTTTKSSTQADLELQPALKKHSDSTKKSHGNNEAMERL